MSPCCRHIRVRALSKEDGTEKRLSLECGGDVYKSNTGQLIQMTNLNFSSFLKTVVSERERDGERNEKSAALAQLSVSRVLSL